MPNNLGIRDCSTTPLCDNSTSTVSLLHLGLGKASNLRTFLQRHQIANTAVFGRIEGEVADLGPGAAVDEKHKSIEAHRNLGKSIKEEQRELSRHAEFIERALAEYVAHCEAAKLRIGSKAAELGVDISTDAEGDVPMGDDAARAAQENEPTSSKYTEEEQETQIEAAIDTPMHGVDSVEVEGDDVKKQDDSLPKKSKSKKSKSKKKKKSQDDTSQEKPRSSKESQTLLTEAERARIKAALAKLEPLENAARIIETGEERRLDENGAPRRPKSTRRAALEAQIKMKEILEFGAKGRPDSARNDIEYTSIWGSDQSQIPSQELVGESDPDEEGVAEMEELIADSEAPEQLSTLTDRVPLKRKRADEAVEERPAKMVLAFRPRLE